MARRCVVTKINNTNTAATIITQYNYIEIENRSCYDGVTDLSVNFNFFIFYFM